MNDFPMGTVTARFTYDELALGRTGANGSAVFRCSADTVRVTVDGRTELFTPGLVHAKIVGGVLMDVDDPDETGAGIELLAGDSEGVSPAGFTWTAVVTLVDAAGKPVSEQSFVVPVAHGKTTDLSEVAGACATGGVITMRGERGETGAPGAAGIGHFAEAIKLGTVPTDTTHEDFLTSMGAVEGPQGKAGPQGRPGESIQGVPGRDGLSGDRGAQGEAGLPWRPLGVLESAANLPATGEPGTGFYLSGGEAAWVWTELDGWAEIASLRGEQGPAGRDGLPGRDGIGLPGRDGASGSQGVSGARGEGVYELWLAEGNSGSRADFAAQMMGVPGRDGKDGAPGKDGADGTPGRDGAPGRDGIAGRDGNDGIPGKDGVDGPAGKDSAVPGPAGKDGAAGKDGVPGKDGASGTDGKSAYQIALGTGFTGTEAEWLASLKGESSGGGGNGGMALMPLATVQKHWTAGPLEVIIDGEAVVTKVNKAREYKWPQASDRCVVMQTTAGPYIASPFDRFPVQSMAGAALVSAYSTAEYTAPLEPLDANRYGDPQAWCSERGRVHLMGGFKATSAIAAGKPLFTIPLEWMPYKAPATVYLPATYWTVSDSAPGTVAQLVLNTLTGVVTAHTAITSGWSFLLGAKSWISANSGLALGYIYDMGATVGGLTYVTDPETGIVDVMGGAGASLTSDTYTSIETSAGRSLRPVEEANGNDVWLGAWTGANASGAIRVYTVNSLLAGLTASSDVYGLRWIYDKSPLTWVPLTLINGATGAIEAALTPDGVVVLRGGFANGATGAPVAVLPEGLRPLKLLIGGSGNPYTRYHISPDGSIHRNQTGSLRCHLTGFTFKAKSEQDYFPV